MSKKRSFTREIRNGGSVSIITVPKNIMDFLDLKEGDKVKVFLEKAQ